MEFNTLEDAQKAMEAINEGEEVTPELSTTEIETAPVEPVAENNEPAPEVIPAVESASEPAPAESGTVQVEELAIEAVKPEDTANLKYNPSFEYNVKGESKEFDDRLKSVIASPEDEDFIRDLVTKADGMEGFKEKLEETKAKQEEYEGTIATLGDRNNALTTFYTDVQKERENGNYRGACKSLGLSDDDILKTAIEIANERNLPAEERTRIENDRRATEQRTLETARVTQYQQQLVQQNADQARQLDEQATANQLKELQFAISSGHSDLATTMKTSNIDLEKEVIATGAYMQQTRAEGQPPVTVAEALKATVDKYSVYTNKPTMPAVSTHTSSRPQPVAIPTIAGGTTSPVATAPKSLDDLQKAFTRLNGEQSAMR